MLRPPPAIIFFVMITLDDDIDDGYDFPASMSIVMLIVYCNSLIQSIG